jgi:hypothetical protein
MSLEYKTLKQSDKLYTHISPDGSFVVTISITHVENSIQTKLVPPELMRVETKVAVALMEGKMIDPIRLSIALKNPPRNEPILLIRHADGTSTILDGREDYCAAIQRGQSTILARSVPFSVWSKLIVTGVPFTDEQLVKFTDERRKRGVPN